MNVEETESERNEIKIKRELKEANTQESRNKD